MRVLLDMWGGGDAFWSVEGFCPEAGTLGRLIDRIKNAQTKGGFMAESVLTVFHYSAAVQRAGFGVGRTLLSAAFDLVVLLPALE